MMLTKCDICKKIIEGSRQSVRVVDANYNDCEFCLKCAKPVINFLKKNKLPVERKTNLAKLLEKKAQKK